MIKPEFAITADGKQLDATSITESYLKAVNVNRNIVIHAQAAQMELYEVCKGLKEMRDGKLYKELGYQNFEEYCETEVGIGRRQANKYIFIVDSLGKDFGNSNSRNLGVQKLYLLSTLSESDREELTERVDIEETTTRQLKAEIDKLKEENSQLENSYFEVKRNCDRAEERAMQLSKEVEELEARPVEVVATESTEEVEKLRTEMAVNDAEWEKKYDALQSDSRERERSIQTDYQNQIAEQRAAFERRIAEVQQSTAAQSSDEFETFKAYYALSYQAFQNLVKFTQSAQNKQMMLEKIHKLYETVMKALEV